MLLNFNKRESILIILAQVLKVSN